MDDKIIKLLGCIMGGYVGIFLMFTPLWIFGILILLLTFVLANVEIKKVKEK